MLWGVARRDGEPPSVASSQLSTPLPPGCFLWHGVDVGIIDVATRSNPESDIALPNNPGDENDESNAALPPPSSLHELGWECGSSREGTSRVCSESSRSREWIDGGPPDLNADVEGASRGEDTDASAGKRKAAVGVGVWVEVEGVVAGSVL